MKKFSRFLVFLTLFLGLIACNDGITSQDTASESGESTEKAETDSQITQNPNPSTQLPQSSKPTPAEEADPNAETYQAGEYRVTLGISEGERTYRGCDAAGNCIDIQGGTRWEDRGQRGISWENQDTTYSISWQEGNSGPMYLTVTENGTQLMREPLVLVSAQNSATARGVSPEGDRLILDYFYRNQDELKVCEPNLDREHSATASEIYSVGEGKYLVKVSCFLAAYQEAFEFWLYEDTAGKITTKPLTLTKFNSEGRGKPTPNDIRTLGGRSTYNPQTELLTIWTQFRGLGDCGSRSAYQFTNDTLKLLSYRAKYECDGNYIEPEQYPQVYP